MRWGKMRERQKESRLFSSLVMQIFFFRSNSEFVCAIKGKESRKLMSLKIFILARSEMFRAQNSCNTMQIFMLQNSVRY